MNTQLEKYLYKKYPELFADHSKPMTETCMCWGCSHGDGWFLLLDKLCQQITYHIEGINQSIEWHEQNEERLKKEGKEIPERPPWAKKKIVDFRFTQVKEKFGALRIYSSGGDEEIESMVSFAETLSRYICEECGKFDTTVGSTTKGWIRSICDECISKDPTSKKAKGWKVFDINKEATKLLNRVKKDNIKNKSKEMKLAIKKVKAIRKRSKKTQ